MRKGERGEGEREVRPYRMIGALMALAVIGASPTSANELLIEISPAWGSYLREVWPTICPGVTLGEMPRALQARGDTVLVCQHPFAAADAARILSRMKTVPTSTVTQGSAIVARQAELKASDAGDSETR